MRRALFWLLAAALIAANVLVIWQSLVVNRFWEDEAFNLTVPRNLLDGLGYTSDGTLSGSTLTPFDPRISTGPTVLLPVTAMLAFGADPVIGARVIPVLYWMLLLAGLFVLGRRIGGRWAGLLAAAVPLAFDTLPGSSPIQGPADLLGEIPAAALVVWALIVLPKRAWLAGLLVGLAVQTKFIALLALPAFAVALWALTPGSGWARVRATLRRSILPLVGVAAPTFLYELAAFLTLGPQGFVRHLRSMGGFLLTGGQNRGRFTIFEKLTTMADAWFVPAWIGLLLALATLAVIAVALVTDVRFRALPPRHLAWLLAALVGSATYLLWWSTASHTPLWVRHPAVGVFAFFPILAAFAVQAARVMWHAPARSARVARARRIRVPAAALTAALAAGIAFGGFAHVLAPTRPQTLAEQRAAADVVREWADEQGVVWFAAQPWGNAVSAIVLAGRHVGLWDAPEMDGVLRVTSRECETDVLLDGTYRVCAAP